MGDKTGQRSSSNRGRGKRATTYHRRNNDSGRMDQLMDMVQQLQHQVQDIQKGSMRKRTRSPASSEPDRKLPKRSENPEFTLLTKELFKNGLLVKAQKNWTKVPDFLESKVCDLVSSIRVPNGDIPLQGRLSTLAKRFASAITTEISEFLEGELEASRRRIDQLDDTDFDMAHEIAMKYMAKRSGTYNRKIESGKKVNFVTANDKYSSRTTKDTSTDYQPNPNPKSGTSHKVNLLSAKLTDVSLDSDNTPKGKRKASTISPEQLAAQEAATSVDFIDCVSDLEHETPIPSKKPLEKRRRPSSTYLRKSPGVFIFTGMKEDWTIQPSEADNVVVLCDSNMRLAEVPPNYDFFVLPGAQLRHATEALKKWGNDQHSGQHTVVLQIGINNRANHPDALDHDIAKLSDAIRDNPKIKRFVYVGVSFPETLSTNEKKNLQHLNQRMFDRWGEHNYVEPIDPPSVEIEERDQFGIHHTGSTRQRVIESLVLQLEQLV